MLNSQFHISVKIVQIKKIHHCFNFAATKRWYHVCKIFIGHLLVQEWLRNKRNCCKEKEDKKTLFYLGSNDEATI